MKTTAQTLGWSTLGWAVLMMLLSGCGGGEGPKLVPARGTVKYKGNPVAGATVTFVFPDNQISTGITDENGRFNLTTGGRPGAPIGKAKVSISKQTTATGTLAKSPDQLTPEDMVKMYAAKGGEAMKGAAQEVKSEIPTKYSNPDSSGFTANVQASDNDFLFEMQD